VCDDISPETCSNNDAWYNQNYLTSSRQCQEPQGRLNKLAVARCQHAASTHTLHKHFNYGLQLLSSLLATWAHPVTHNLQIGGVCYLREQILFKIFSGPKFNSIYSNGDTYCKFLNLRNFWGDIWSRYVIFMILPTVISAIYRLSKVKVDEKLIQSIIFTNF
jgi:hypothetical protein